MVKDISKNCGIDEKIPKQIKDIVLKYKKAEKIVIFGSRAKSSFKKTSDIDIAVFGETWTDKDINLVKNILDDSLKTPLKIDVVNFYAIKKDKMRENILKEGVVLYEH